VWDRLREAPACGEREAQVAVRLVHRGKRRDRRLELARGVVEAPPIVQLEPEEIVRHVVPRRHRDRMLEERGAVPPDLGLSRRRDGAREHDGTGQGEHGWTPHVTGGARSAPPHAAMPKMPTSGT
jgi:hypothetical protein